MGCDCGKPKCDGHCGVSPAVLQINNPSECVLFHRVEVPASMGDSKTNPPKNGEYKNVLLYYETDQTSWLYSSDGIPTKLTNGLTNYEDAINLPQINGVTLLGNKSLGDLGITDAIDDAVAAEKAEREAADEALGDEIDDINDELLSRAAVFDTVADMKASTDLKNGMAARTLGFHSVNDGGGATYKITNSGTANEMDVIAVGDLRASLILGGHANVMQLGAYGDGITDDTAILQNAINEVSTLGVNKLVLPSGEYVVSGALTLPSNFYFMGMPDSVLKYVGDGYSGDIISVSGIDADNPAINVTLDNINIDGSDQIYKGGYSSATPTVTHTNPAYRGLVCVNAAFVKNLTIKDCTFNDVYGEGIRGRYITDAKINNNTLRDVSSGNIQVGGQTGYDNHGDAIVFFFSYNISIDSNTVINRRVYQDGISAAIGKPCGRSGLEYEYALNNNAPADEPDDPAYNAPDYSDLPTQVEDGKNYRYGIGLRMTNNYVYGYTKGIHLENRVKAIICDNTVLFNHIGILLSVDNYTTVNSNYIDPLNVGPAPQSGYDADYGCICVSEYNPTPKRYGITISNNILLGEGKAVNIGCSYVNVTNNVISSYRGVFTQTPDLKDIKIINNNFNSINAREFLNFMLVYHVESATIAYNSFYSEVLNVNDVSGNNIKIIGNEFVNTAINHNYGGTNIAVRDNLFKGDKYNVNVINIAYGNDSVIDNNTFEITNFNTSDRYPIRLLNGSINCTFSNNKFSVESTLSTPVMARFEVITNCKLINNKLYNNSANYELLRFYNALSCTVTDNMVENPLSAVIHSTGSFQGCSTVERNIGLITVAGYYPNNGTSIFVNNFFQKSQKMYKYNINSGVTSLGWVCTSGGYYVTDTWTSGSSYNVGKLIKNSSDNVYKCITKGSGNVSVEPTHTTATNVTGSDGYEWQYLGSVATFKELGV